MMDGGRAREIKRKRGRMRKNEREKDGIRKKRKRGRERDGIKRGREM